MNRAEKKLSGLLSEGKISKDDYLTLQRSMSKEPSLSVLDLLINPWPRYAGTPCLVAGLIVFAFLSLLAKPLCLHFPAPYFLGAVNATSQWTCQTAPAALPWVQLVIYALTFAAFGWIVCRLLGSRVVRFVDLLSVGLLLRLPFLALTPLLVSPPSGSTKPGVLRTILSWAHITSLEVGNIFVIIWVGCLVFTGFRALTGLVGNRLWIAFALTFALVQAFGKLLAQFVSVFLFG